MSYFSHRRMNKNKIARIEQGRAGVSRGPALADVQCRRRLASGQWRVRCERTLAWLLLALLTLAAGPVGGAERGIRINLGTLAPRGSVYHKSLQAMAEAWRQAPGGGVRLVICPDGTQGGETDMVRLIRVGSLQAGLLTAVGLSDIEPGVGWLQNIPMIFRSLDEFEKIT